MEVTTAEDVEDHPRYLLFYGGVFPLVSARSIPCCFPCSLHRLSLTSIGVLQDMGRRSWASPEQREYLETFVPQLQRAKETTTLNTLYEQVYEGFLEQWEPEPIGPPFDPSKSPEQLEDEAKARLHKVRLLSNALHLCAHGLLAHRQLVWRGTKEGKAKTVDSPILCTSTSRPQPLGQVEAKEASLPPPSSIVHPPLAAEGISAPPRGRGPLGPPDRGFYTRNPQAVPQRDYQSFNINLGEAVVSYGGYALEVYPSDPRRTY